MTVSEAVSESPRLDTPASEPTRRRRALIFAAQAAVPALIIAVMMHMRWSYGAGGGDQWVLSLLGMHWANPDYFANDWAMVNAPQPHWFFDVITWFGAKTGTLGGVYLVYWMISLAVFGSATALLANSWAPKHVWLAVVAFPIFAGVVPLWLLGNGSSLYPIAVPSVLAAYLMYLMIAALMTERHKPAAIIGPLLAVIHLQVGLLGAVLLLSVAGVVFLRVRKIDGWLVTSAAVSMVIIYLELKLRPVAGHTKDFAEACEKLIPYHCDANSWDWKEIVGSCAVLFGFTALTFLYLKRDLWLRAVVIIVLPALALIAGVAMDYFNVPTLGQLSQGMYINRLSVILFPFGMWGVLAPFLGRVKGGAGRVAFGLLALFGGLAFLQKEWGLQFAGILASPRKLALAGVLTISLAALAVWAIRRIRREPHLLKPMLLAGLALAVAMSFGFKSGMEHPMEAARRLVAFTPNFIVDGNQRAWGQQVEKIVPPGDQILIPILSDEIRLITKRAVVVDCKYGPYGGPPWHEYSARIQSLGGFEECRQKLIKSAHFTAAYMTEQARRYGANYMVVDQTGYWRIDDLVAKEGWEIVLRPADPGQITSASKHYKYYLLKASQVG